MRQPYCKWIVPSSEVAISAHDKLACKFNHKTTKYQFCDFKQGFLQVSSNPIMEASKLGEPIRSQIVKDSVFFPEKEPGKLNEYEWKADKREDKIKVTLVNGEELYIIPFAEKPKKMIFSFVEDEVQPDKVTPDNPKYTELGFNLLNEVRAEKGFDEQDSRVIQFVTFGLLKSYNVNLDLLNLISGISTVVDIGKIFYACCGVAIDENGKFVEEPVKKN
jgi:hypothetical protein